MISYTKHKSPFNYIWDNMGINSKKKQTIILDLDEVCYNTIMLLLKDVDNDNLKYCYKMATMKNNTTKPGYFDEHMSIMKINNTFTATLFIPNLFDMLEKIWNKSNINIVLYSNGSTTYVNNLAQRMLYIMKKRLGKNNHRLNFSQIIHRHSSVRQGKYVKYLDDINKKILDESEKIYIIDDSFNMVWKISLNTTYRLSIHQPAKWLGWTKELGFPVKSKVQETKTISKIVKVIKMKSKIKYIF